MKLAAVYFTDNYGDQTIIEMCRYWLLHLGLHHKMDIISVSQKPINFGKNIVVPYKRLSESIFRQIKVGVDNTDADIIFLLEHDVLYHPSHFDLRPTTDHKFYYNRNRFQVDWHTGKTIFRLTKCTSHMYCYRDYLKDYMDNLIKIIDENGHSRTRMGYAPGTHRFFHKYGINKKYTVQARMSEFGNIDIRHDTNWSKTRWKKSEHHDPRAIRGWKEVTEIEGWGKPLEVFADVKQTLEKEGYYA